MQKASCLLIIRHNNKFSEHILMRSKHILSNMLVIAHSNVLVKPMSIDKEYNIDIFPSQI